MDYLINTAGEFITPIGFDFISKQSELTAVIFNEGKWGYINLQGETLISPQYNHAWPFSNELAFVKMGSKSAFIDKNNNVYKTEDILCNSQNPSIIAKYGVENGIYKFINTYNTI